MFGQMQNRRIISTATAVVISKSPVRGEPFYFDAEEKFSKKGLPRYFMASIK